MEETALNTLRTMFARRKLDTATERLVIEGDKKMERVTTYTVGTVLVCFRDRKSVV